jgi:hypothetical protein
MKLLTPKYCFLYFILSAFLFSASSCKKDSFITSADAVLNTSDDILKYDTVFTSIGSITKSFTIRNENSQKLLLSSVKVMGGTASPYKININGIAAQEATNIELPAEDSMYVFVTVNIDPNLSNLPFIVKDSIQIIYNGNTKFVQLEAFGQNANFLRDGFIESNTTWNNRLPYVILDRLRIDTNITLTLDSGCRVYCHADAPILIDGTLITNGTKEHPVIFAGDRVDEDYKDLPASWPGIYFRETSKSNELNFTTVKNAYQAVVAEGPADNLFPKVTLHQSIVDNAYDVGLYCVNSSVDADNSLITNCGTNINIIYGGTYNFINCTVAAYSTFISHKNPVLSAVNFATLSNGSIGTMPLNATFTNCIFWGEEGFVENEVVVQQQGSTTPVEFKNCLYRANADPAFSTFLSCIKNENPAFDSIDVSKRIFDFHFNNNFSMAVDAGTVTSFPKDLDNNDRILNAVTDIGCYEKQ